MSKHLWFSTGIHAQDLLVARHKARMEAIETAIAAFGELRASGQGIDSLPADINDARQALWRAYHAEKSRRPEPMPAADREHIPS